MHLSRNNIHQENIDYQTQMSLFAAFNVSFFSDFNLQAAYTV